MAQLKTTKLALQALLLGVAVLTAHEVLAAPHGGGARASAHSGAIGGRYGRFLGVGGVHGYGPYFGYPYGGYAYPYAFGFYGLGPWAWNPPSPYAYPYALDDDYTNPPPYPVYPAPPPPPPPPPYAPPEAPAPRAQKTFIVYFPLDRADLTSDAQRMVRSAATYAQRLGAAHVAVVGYTDAAGSEGYNQALSERRSQSVRDALSVAGLNPGQIEVRWRGKHDLAVKTADGVPEPSNRRVVVMVAGQEPRRGVARASGDNEDAAEPR